jgi:hypothetical protein
MTILPWRIVTGTLVPIAGGNVLIFSTRDKVNPFEEFE